MEQEGDPSFDNQYLLNGDFVDRGPQSLEVVLTILALKIIYPYWVHLNRGNHESQFTTSEYGFQIELENRLDASCCNLALNSFLKFFKALPLACVVQGRATKLFVVHGGIPIVDGEPVSLEEIGKIHRHVEPLESTANILTELLWNDPCPMGEAQPSKRGGWGKMFGPGITKRFLNNNYLTRLIRSHEDIESTVINHSGCMTGSVTSL